MREELGVADLLVVLGPCSSLLHQSDSWVWWPNSNGHYSVSAYKFQQHLVPSEEGELLGQVWSSFSPYNVMVFAWRLLIDKCKQGVI